MSRNIFFLLYCVEKTNDGKWPFFDKNHWLTPLENFDFFYFFHVHKTFFCIQNITKQSFCLILRKKKLSCRLPFPVALWLELGLAFCATEKHLSLPNKCSKVHFPWGRTNLKEGNMGGKHSMGWDGSILFLFHWGRGRATFQRYVWGGLAFHTLLYTNFKHFPTHLYILQLQLVKSRPFQIYRLKRVLL